ncbi:MAG: GDP-mannose 4,6-dehydratase [Chloroflexota bacterium]|nr:GDP-mannose 4,6-dehydratase [Chloroflexota bacterium]
MQRVLVTGCEGFVGSHLADLLVERGLEVYGTVHGDARCLEQVADRMAVLACDMRERRQVEAIVGEVRPDIVFHLAAQSYVTVSWAEPQETLETNVLGTFYLLEALAREGLDATVEVIGSSSVYGPCQAQEMPLVEGREFRPTSMYAVSKVNEDMLGYFYWKAHGLNVVRVRPFNMTGPRKAADACSDFARGIAEVERGLKGVLLVGNLDTVRDITDGRDAVQALWLLAERGEPGQVYNLCSGRAYRMGDILETLLGLAEVRVEYRVDPSRMRPFDDPIYVGDSSRLRGLGWEPQIPIERTLSDLLDYWRERVNGAGG